MMLDYDVKKNLQEVLATLPEHVRLVAISLLNTCRQHTTRDNASSAKAMCRNCNARWR